MEQVSDAFRAKHYSYQTEKVVAQLTTTAGVLVVMLSFAIGCVVGARPESVAPAAP